MNMLTQKQLESVYRSVGVVANICVHAAQDKNKPIAIIVPAEPALKKLASQNGIQGHGLEDLVHDKKLNSLVLKEMQGAGRSGGLAGIEIVDGVVLAGEEWTPQNVSLNVVAVAKWSCTDSASEQGLTTSAQKINRRGILDKYRKQVDVAYAKAS